VIRVLSEGVRRLLTAKRTDARLVRERSGRE
jgi:hypothetical protein